MKNHLSIIGRATAAICFIIGTVLFALQMYFKESDLTYIGFVFIAVTFIINSILLFIITISIFFSENKLGLLQTIGIMLLNIPIASFYLYILINNSIIF